MLPPFPTPAVVSRFQKITGEARPSKYWAFISYSHRDARVARALQRALETYRMPKKLVGLRTPAGEVPARLKPVFLDRDELQAGTDLQTSVRYALAQSRFLIVVCSPDSARSPWVQQEIVEFKKMHGESRVLAVIARGEPFASGIPGREAEECFPLGLRAELTSSGFADGPALEPIAADLRPHADGPRRGPLKLIAGMVGVGADVLLRRDAKRRIRQLALVAAGSLAGMAAMGVLAVTAIRSRNDAQLQRAEAENLLEFMLGDLRKKLDPVGRLDVLDGVGEQALAYYARQEAGQLDANALGRRSRALHLIGEMREQRGQLDLAQAAFERAAETTAQLLARAPGDARRIFDQAQSVYWVGHAAWLRGEVATAEKAFETYVRLAEQLVRIDAANLDWQTEVAYAHGNLGVVYLHTSRLDDALRTFGETRALWETLAVARPPRAFDLANNLGWIAKVYEAQGDFERAIATQREKIAALARVPQAETSQVVKRSLRVANGELAKLELALGRPDTALEFMLTAMESARALVSLDPQNKTWLEQLHIHQTSAAEMYLAAGNHTRAGEMSRQALTGTKQLLALDPKVANWQVNLRGRALSIGAQLAAREEQPALIAELEDYLVKVRQFISADRGVNQVQNVTVAEAELMLGVLLANHGRAAEAAAHWRATVSRLQPYADRGDLPALTSLATARFRLGDDDEARAIAQRIESTTYRHPAYADLVRMLAVRAGRSVAQP